MSYKIQDKEIYDILFANDEKLIEINSKPLVEEGGGIEYIESKEAKKARENSNVIVARDFKKIL